MTINEQKLSKANWVALHSLLLYRNAKKNIYSRNDAEKNVKISLKEIRH